MYLNQICMNKNAKSTKESTHTHQVHAVMGMDQQHIKSVNSPEGSPVKY